MSNAETIDRHLAMFQSGDVDGLVADYAPDGVLMIDDQVIQGPTALRQFFENVFTAMFPGGVKLDVKSRVASGDVVLITWSAAGANLVAPLGSDTFLLEDGRIRVHTAALKVEPAGAAVGVWP